MSSLPEALLPPAPPRISYAAARDAALADPRVLATFEFAANVRASADPRAIQVRLPALLSPGRCEVWRVDTPVRSGREGTLRWSEGGGWLLVALEEAEGADGVEACGRRAYQRLLAHLGATSGWHVQRLWNHVDDINIGAGDAERYRQFCSGRRAGMAAGFPQGFPAATAVGHPERTGTLQVFCLAARMPGRRLENPRQLSAWRYPRQYGPVPPSFARAMRLPGGHGLAISGTAAIQGHASRHAGDLDAQLAETMVNLDVLLAAGGTASTLGARSVLKAYVRHGADLDRVDAFLAARVPEAARLVVQADICRRELLVEIEGWHFN